MKGVRTNPVSGFDPRSIPDCQLWLDAADRSTLTFSGSSVTQWNDKSGNGYAATNIGTITTTTQNGRTALDFGSNRMTISSYNWRTHSSFFAVIKAAVGGFLFSQQVGSTYYNYYYTKNWPLFNATNTTTSINLSDSVNATDVAVIPANSYCLFAFAYAGGTTSSFYTVNGTSRATTSSTGIIDALRTFPLFINGNSSVQSDTTQVCEIVHYNRALGTADRQQVEGYLTTKWGLRANLPATHPFKSLPPVLRPFTPTDISGCQLWLDAADQNVLTLSGSNVTTWNDKSGVGNHATQATTSNQPTYSSNSVVFSGNQLLLSAASASLSTETVFIVANVSSSGGATGSLLGSVTTLNNSTSGLGGRSVDVDKSPGNQLRLVRQFLAVIATGSFTTYDTPSLIGTMTTGTTAFVYTNGSQTGTAAWSTAYTAGLSTIIGRNGYSTSASLFFTGSIQEIVLFSAALTTPQRQQVEGYLARKWGVQTSLPSTHPYRSLPVFSTGFTPSAIPGCSMWLDGLDVSGNGMIPANGTTLSTWVDKSGNGRNASGGTPGTVVDGGVSFNGTNTSYALSVPYSSNYSIFLVATNTSKPQCYFFGRNSIGGARDPTFIQGYIGAGIGLQWYESSDMGTIATTPTSPFLASVDHTQGGRIKGYYHGSQSFDIAQTRAFLGAPWDILGQAGSALGYYGGIMKELIFYSNVVSRTERQQVEGYLAAKWGLRSNLPTSHPYRLTKP